MPLVASEGRIVLLHENSLEKFLHAQRAKAQGTIGNAVALAPCANRLYRCVLLIEFSVVSFTP